MSPLPASLRQAACRFPLIAGLIATALVARPSLASPPTTAPPITAPPTTAPATTAPTAANLDRWYAGLAHRDPAVREESRSHLLGLARDDLSELEAAVRRAGPARPSQALALYDIVLHVYLSGEPYTKDPSHGFLGVIFDNRMNAEEPEPGGVEIGHRLRGYCAYRMLEDGDIVQAVLGPSSVEVHAPDEMIAAIGGYEAGDTVTLLVLRRGRTARLTVKLDARPIGLGPGPDAIEAFRITRDNQADDFWEQHFAPLVSGQAL